MISVVIRTTGRPSLNDAIKSALREFDEVIVVADSVNYSVRTGDNCPHITMGCSRHNMIVNNIVNKKKK